jgi:MYXO-CTERM domain-containing protein
VTYSWSYVSAKWNITVYGTPTQTEPTYKATVVETSYPQTMAGGSQAKATVKYTNAGTAAWDADTRLGTTDPRDRESPFYSSTDWVAKNRAAAAAPTKPGATATFSFTLSAPSVTAPTDYVECFNLVQEKVAWFSTPGDKQVCLKIQVTPAPAPAVELVEASVASVRLDPPQGPGGPTGHGNPGTGPQPAEGGCAVTPRAPSPLPLPILALLGLGLALQARRRSR